MRPIFTLILLGCFCFAKNAFSQGETFNQTILNTKPAGTANDYRLAHPFEILFGPDAHLYITEKVGRVLRVDTAIGMRTVILDYQSFTYLTISRNGSAPFAATSIGQDGMMGMALHPNFSKGTGQDSIFLAYTTAAGQVQLSRFKFNRNNTGAGLVSEYFNNTTLSAPATLNQTDANIDNSWGAGGPGGGIGTDNFSVRWTGNVLAPVTGNYTFTTTTSDGIRLWVNGALVINQWINQGVTTLNSAAIPLVAGQRYDIRMEYYENTATAQAQLQWTYPGQALQVIPATQFGKASTYMTGETILLQDLPAGSDHSTGRLVIGPDNKLYYSCGDLGANQFAGKCNPIRSQNLPSLAEIGAANYSNYAGKVLRINFDGSIPSDNPTLGTVQSHVFTLGHRNPQGLVWQKNPSNGGSFPVMTPGGKLFSTEHGPRTDDEINIIQSGKNYGWPFIAGFNDQVNYQYVNWSSAPPANCAATAYNENAIPPGATIYQEGTGAGQGVNNLSTGAASFQPPLMSNFAACNTAPNCNAGGTNWMQFPTIAPSSVDFYNLSSGQGIPNWYPSLLIPTLRRGTLYRVKLDPTMTNYVTDTIPYFVTSNRYRDIAISPNGRIYMVTDSIGSTSGPSGTGTSVLNDRGAILEYRYTGSILAVRDNPSPRQINDRSFVSVYPNPAITNLYVESQRGTHKPLHIEIYDVTGKQVLRGKSSKDNFVINLESFVSGVYVLKLYNGYNSLLTTEKIVVQK